MALLKVVLLTDSGSFNLSTTLPHNNHDQKLWDTIETTIIELNYRCETVELDQLEVQEQKTVDKFHNADIVIMVR